MMSEKRKIQRFNLDEGRIWEAIEGLSPYKTTYTLEEVCEKLNEQQTIIKSKDKQLERLYNYFKAYLEDEMSSNAFSEMWDFVKEDEKWEDEL